MNRTAKEDLLHAQRVKRVWNALADIRDPRLREIAFGALEDDIAEDRFYPGWFQVGPYIIGVADEHGTIAVHELTSAEKAMIGWEALEQRYDFPINGGPLGRPHYIGKATVLPRVYCGQFIVNVWSPK